MGIKRIHDLATAGVITGAELMQLEQAGIDCQVPVSSLVTFGQQAGAIVVNPTGVAATDTANWIAADILSGSVSRVVTGASDPYALYRTLLGSGTHAINASLAMMNPVYKQAKVRGRVFEGRSDKLTTVLYTGTGPMGQNQFYQNVEMYGFSVSNATGEDFYWSQEQAGVTNIQHDHFEDMGFIGTWGKGFRFTGTNNNSENRWRNVGMGNCSTGIYVPPLTACTITSGSNQIALVNSPLIAAVGDTVQFTVNGSAGSIGSGGGQITYNTPYYVVGSTATYIQVSATSGGAAITPNGSIALSVQAATDQFLNFEVDSCSFIAGVKNNCMIDMGFGGSIILSGINDVSGWAPTVDTYLINLRAGIGGTKSRGSQSFKCGQLRVEHLSDHALVLNSFWPGGVVSIDHYDGSSSYVSRTPTVQYFNFNIANSSGPTVEISNSQIPGQIGISYGSNAYKFASNFLIRNSTLLQQDSSSLIVATATGGNTGGFPSVIFRDIINNASSDNTGQTPAMDQNLGWNKAIGAIAQMRVFNLTGANSDLPGSNGHTVPVSLPLGAALCELWFWKNAGSGNTGAFQYTVQTMEASPTVIAGGVATPMAGASAGSAIPLYRVVLTTPLELTTTLMRQLTVADTLSGGRSGAFTNFRCLAFAIC